MNRLTLLWESTRKWCSDDLREEGKLQMQILVLGYLLLLL